MNIKQAKDEIRHTVLAYLMQDELGAYRIPAVRQRPILLIGPPGIGKTAIMSQVAAECGVALVAYTITHHTRQSAIGLPYIEKKQYDGKTYAVTEYTMSEIVASIYDKIEATGLKNGILFIDEINCVSETLAPTMLQFLQGKTFGNHRIPEGWVIVTAGNPPEYNQSVRSFDIVTLDRVKKITVDADYGVWKQYAMEKGVHSAILAYLEIKKDHFYLVESTVDGQEIVTARGWEDLSNLMQVYEMLNIPVTESVIIQYIQNPRIAKDFANYLDLYRKYQTDYDVDAVVEGRIKASAVESIKKAVFDEKISVISLLISRLTAGFRQTYAQDRYVRTLFEELKSLKTGLEKADPSGKDTLVLLEDHARALDIEIGRKQQNGQPDSEELTALRQTEKAVSSYRKQLIDQNVREPGKAFEMIRSAFEEETQKRRQMFVHGGECLENAFSFMEQAFGESQEMVMFVTELNANTWCIRFIRDNGSEKYDRYNKSLLFDETRQSLLREIDSVSDLTSLLEQGE